MKSNQPKPDPERKKQASELLKSADKLLHAGEFAEAMQEIEKTLSIDPGNFYALAYKERILDAQAAATKAPKPSEKPKLSGTSTPPVRPSENKALGEKVRREEEARLRDEEAREETQEETRHKAQEKTRQKIQEEARRETQEEVRQ